MDRPFSRDLWSEEVRQVTSINHVSVGNSGVGTLGVSGLGTQVSSRWGGIGVNGGSGSASFSFGSLWDIASTLTVGGNVGGATQASGELMVQTGATVHVGGTLEIANSVGGAGSVVIQGVGSTLEPERIEVGNSGPGTLEVRSGGLVSQPAAHNHAWIGSGIDGSGLATVDGAGSSWVSAGNVYLGREIYSGSGTFGNWFGVPGTLRITNDGLVEARSVIVHETYGTLETNTGGTLRINGGTLSGISDLSGMNVEFVNGASGSYGALTVDSALNVSSGSVVTTTDTLDVTHAGLLGGNGQVTGNVTNSGTLAPGNSAGSFTIDGDYAQTTSGTLNIELGGTTPGLEYDVLAITGTTAIEGMLDVSLLFGFDLETDMEFEIVDIGGTRTGSFAGLSQGAVFGDFGGLKLRVDYTGGDGNDIVLTAVPEPSAAVMIALGLGILGLARGQV